MNQLTTELRDNVLAYLKVEAAQPDLNLLDRLLGAYVRIIPWESASRIAKRSRTPDLAACPRFADEFWHDALTYHTGGTCYESNYAFSALLNSLGYETYLTINNMGETIGCHSATIVRIGDQRWLADAGIQLIIPLHIDPQQETKRDATIQTYSAKPTAENIYTIYRAPHPVPEMFTLIDVPVTDEEYRTITTNDYGENGLFLDQVVLNMVINEQLWRFNSRDSMSHFQRFADGTRYEIPIEGDTAQVVSAHFGVDESIVRAALRFTDEAVH